MIAAVVCGLAALVLLFLKGADGGEERERLVSHPVDPRGPAPDWYDPPTERDREEERDLRDQKAEEDYDTRREMERGL